MDATHMRLGVLIGAIMLVGWVAGCGSSAKLMSGLSIEELKPVPGILPSARLIRGTISSFSGDRVEVETGERAPRYLSLEAGGDEARGLQPGGAVEIMVNDRDEIVAYQRPADQPPTKVFRGSLGRSFNPQKERVTIRLDTGRDVGFYARRVAMEKLAALEVGETADFAVDRAYLLVDVFSLGKPRELAPESSSRAPHHRLQGAFVTIGDGRMRLRMKIDDIQSFPVRPLLQPAIEQLAPNALVSVYLDAPGQVPDMVRATRRCPPSAARGAASEPTGWRVFGHLERKACATVSATTLAGCACSPAAVAASLMRVKPSRYMPLRSCPQAASQASTSFLVFFQMGVAMAPGAMSATRMPQGWSSRRNASVIASSACFDAA